MSELGDMMDEANKISEDILTKGIDGFLKHRFSRTQKTENNKKTEDVKTAELDDDTIAFAKAWQSLPRAERDALADFVYARLKSK